MDIVASALLTLAQDAAEPAANFDWRELLEAGGYVGYVIVALSVVMVTLIMQQMFSLRRGNLMPRWLAEQAHQLISTGRFSEANELCKKHPCFLGDMIQAGLSETEMGYLQVQKALEDASAEHSARMMRKVEYLNVIGTIAPMLGLLGTVWGMIQAFLEFESQASPSVSEFAPGISHALITTLMGLSVAIPALGAFAILRNRVDELVSETSLLAEQVFAGYKRWKLRRKPAAAERGTDA
ncbi:MotA/TolQ/ExbB proton channel family protein [Rubinisphaera sp. JC750]|uniref:MotA/TolQ/ExbB proton channel family protein n=1 Tax=Rubinisphaera sp. JC750 TaxID=2898658 RepID=UPI001F403551|nr:MotA/TolQ/ExbB proton channel family protein [Rubinisphaera sp. JC750]